MWDTRAGEMRLLQEVHRTASLDTQRTDATKKTKHNKTITSPQREFRVAVTNHGHCCVTREAVGQMGAVRSSGQHSR